jgi:ABC-type Na+ efflux pump permease subunit
MRKALGYLLIAASVVGGVYMVFVTFQQWLGNGTTQQLLLDGVILLALLAVFIAGYYLATAMDVRR